MRKKQTILAALLILYIVLPTRGISFPKLHPGRCPDIDVVQNFDIPAYMGKWYQEAGYNTEWVAGGDARCVSAEYDLDAASAVVTVHNKAIDNKTNTTKEIKGTAVLADPSKNEAKLVVTFNIGWYGDVHGKYWVLGTDYSNLSVVYACNNVLLLHFYTIWILSRDQYFVSQDKEVFFNRTGEILRDHGIDPAVLHMSEQAYCAV